MKLLQPKPKAKDRGTTPCDPGAVGEASDAAARRFQSDSHGGKLSTPSDTAKKLVPGGNPLKRCPSGDPLRANPYGKALRSEARRTRIETREGRAP